jgi:hypothetical protein
MSNTANPGDEEARNEDAHDEANRQNQRGRRRGDQDEDKESVGQSDSLQATAVAGPAFAAPEHHVRDLSADLMTMLPRSSGQIVRCRRVYGDHYRCNWWGSRGASAHDNAGASGVMVTRYRVIKSRMLRATVTRDGVAVDADGQQ